MRRIDARIDLVEPACITAGVPSVLYVAGWCAKHLGSVEVLLDGHPTDSSILPLPTVGVESGERFAALVPVNRSLRPGSHGLSIRATSPGGELDTDELAHFELETPNSSPRPPLPRVSGSGPLVAICMATHEPPEQLFARQIESIRTQTHRRFVCIVSDDASSPAAWARIQELVAGDERFVFFRSDARLGFYRKFERALELVPAEATLVALSDQDDRWYPEKLEALIAAVEGSGALLACSDMRIVRADGQQVAPSYWADRPARFDRLSSLLLTNTVTGASAMFRASLLADALPFPPDIGRPFHDHWIASVALGLGEIEYVDEPLYDYVQHGANAAGSHAESNDVRGGLVFALCRLAASPRRLFASSAIHARGRYLEELMRVELFARTLELRLGGRVRADRALELHRLARLTSSSRSLLWLLGRSARDVSGRSETLGAENQLLKAIAWKRSVTLRRRARVLLGRG